MRSPSIAAVVAAITVLTGVVVAATTASAAAPSGGTYVAVTPARVVNSYNGTDGNLDGALGANASTTVKFGDSVPATGVSAVAVTITVQGPTADGSLVAFAYAAGAPSTANVQFVAHHQASDAAVVPTSDDSRIRLKNNSSGSVQIFVDVSGYYTAGAPTAPGAYHPIGASRVVSTISGLDGNHKGAVKAGGGITPSITGHGGVPSGVRAVAVTVSVYQPKGTGSVTAYRNTDPKPTAPTVQFAAGVRSSGFTIVPVYSDGRIGLINRSSGTVQLAVDVVGYITGGVSTQQGTYQLLSPARVLDSRYGTAGNHKGSLGPGETISVTLAGKRGVPLSGATAALVTVSTLNPPNGGGLTVWGSGSRPATTNLQFNAGQAASDLAVVPVAGKTVQLYNGTAGRINLTMDVVGYYLDGTITPPATSVGRYLNDLKDPTKGTNLAKDMTIARTAGTADGNAGSSLVLLDLGAQTITDPLSKDDPGVALALTAPTVRIDYPNLVDILDAYVDGFTSAAPGLDATLAIGTNNEGDFAAYYPSQRGKDWANLLVDKVAAHAPSGITVVGANDIEPDFDFGSTQPQAQTWTNNFLSSSNAGADSLKLIYNGSADGCAFTLGSTGGTCGNHYTQAGLYNLAHDGTQIEVLPQVYFASQAIQWANIDATGSGNLIFAGSLTENGADDTTYLPGEGWAQLYHSIASVDQTPDIPAAVDISPDS